MAKYLFQGSYTEKGVEGLRKEGGSKRRKAIEKVTKGLGGKVEAFYFTFGKDDFAVIVEVPSGVEAAAVALAVNASGAVRARTTVLLSPEEIDKAAKKSVSYRAPGKPGK
ncbi:MAG: GYD domain-containing protein [Gemmatimonadota bacterium]